MEKIYAFFSDQSWREEKVDTYASVGLLIFLTSFFWAPSRDFMHVIYAAVFFAPVLVVLLLRKPDFRQYGGWFTALALLYAGYAAFSTLWSPAPRPDTFALHWLLLAVWLSGTAWLASRQRISTRQISSVLVITGAVASVVYQALFHWHSHPLGYDTEWATRLGLFGWGVPRNPNTIAFFFGTTTIFAYLRWLDASSWRQNGVAAVFLALNVFPVFAAQSRGVLLCLAFVLPLAFWLYRRPLRKWRAHFLVLGTVAGSVFLCGFHIDIAALASTRLAERSARAEIWNHVANESMAKHPWFGTGLVKHSRINVPEISDRLPTVIHAHNSYLDALYRTGIVGLLFMLAHMIFVFCHWSRSPELLPLFFWLLLGCLVSFVANPGFFWYLDAVWWSYWIPAGLISALVSASSCDVVY